jgi:hypothetical protein
MSEGELEELSCGITVSLTLDMRRVRKAVVVTTQWARDQFLSVRRWRSSFETYYAVFVAQDGAQPGEG